MGFFGLRERVQDFERWGKDVCPRNRIRITHQVVVMAVTMIGCIVGCRNSKFHE